MKTNLIKTTLTLLSLLILTACNRPAEEGPSFSDYLLLNLDVEALEEDKAAKQGYYNGEHFSFDLPVLAYSKVIFTRIWDGTEGNRVPEIAEKNRLRRELLAQGINPSKRYRSELVELGEGRYGYRQAVLQVDQTGDYRFELHFVFFVGEIPYAIIMSTADQYLRDELIAAANMDFFYKEKRADIHDFDPDNGFYSRREFNKQYIYFLEDEKGFIDAMMQNRAGAASELYNIFLEVVDSFEYKD